MCVGTPARRLRSRCLLAAHDQSSYFLWRSTPAQELPWSLLIGDVDENLRELVSSSMPSDAGCAAKIWQLLKLNTPVELIKEGLQLLGSLSWSAKRTEEGHVTGSRSVRHHNRGCEASLIVRSQLGQLRPLVNRAPQDRALLRLDDKITRLEKKNPEKCGAKQMYMGAMINLVTERRKNGAVMRHDATQHCVAKHGQMWAELSLAHRQGWHERAVAHRHEAQQQIAHDLEEARLQRRQLLDEMSEEKPGPLTLTKLRFSELELLEFDSLWDDSFFSNSRVATAVADLQVRSQPLSHEELAVLALHAVQADLALKSPSWAIDVCRNRDYFRNTILKLKYLEDGMNVFLLVLWCLQNPLVASFLDLEVASLEEQDPCTFVGESEDDWRHAFRVLPLSLSYSNRAEYDAEVEVEVLSDAVLLGNAFAVSDSDWADFATFLSAVPAGAHAPRAADSRPRLPNLSRIDPAVLLEHPWLLDVLHSRKTRVGPVAAGHVAHDLEDADGDTEEHVVEVEARSDSEGSEQEIDLDFVATELEKKRSAEATAASVGPFGWKVMGGAWYMATYGVPYNVFRATYVMPVGREFLASYGFNLSCSCTLSKFGDDLARCLVEYWVRKLTYFFSILDAAGRGAYKFTDEDLRDFVEPPAFAAAWDAATARQQDRMAELRRLRPAHP